MPSWTALNKQIIACEHCPRLRKYCQEIATEKRRAFADWTYWGRPVPNFGDPAARLLIVGLAPAAHGANRTGRMFTGDRSGEWLYRALYKAGFANQPDVDRSRRRSATRRLRDHGDRALRSARQSSPQSRKSRIADRWLVATIDRVPVKVLLALGQIAWQGVVREARRATG